MTPLGAFRNPGVPTPDRCLWVPRGTRDKKASASAFYAWVPPLGAFRKSGVPLIPVLGCLEAPGTKKLPLPRFVLGCPHLGPFGIPGYVRTPDRYLWEPRGTRDKNTSVLYAWVIPLGAFRNSLRIRGSMLPRPMIHGASQNKNLAVRSIDPTPNSKTRGGG